MDTVKSEFKIGDTVFIKSKAAKTFVCMNSSKFQTGNYRRIFYVGGFWLSEDCELATTRMILLEKYNKIINCS